MNDELFSRTEVLLGKESLARLHNSKVAVFGVGGVGSYTVEALVRAGIGELLLIDADTVAKSNINRQLIADTTTVGRQKTDVAEERAHRINPDIKIRTVNRFFDANSDYSLLCGYDMVVDAIDTVSAKISIAEYCYTHGIPLITATSAGNKTDPTRFTVSDIYSTSVCPICRIMRRELKRRGVDKLKVVYSTEKPLEVEKPADGTRPLPGSLPFVPSVMGLIIAREAVFDIIRSKK